MRNIFSVLVAFSISTFSFAETPIKNILLEEFSTAPCGFCPEGDIIARDIVARYPQVIWVTHHAGFGTDSMTAPESITIANVFTNFAPGAVIDRGDYPIPDYTIPPRIAVARMKWDSICTARLGDEPIADVKITNDYNSSTRKLTCTFTTTFITLPASGDMRLNIYLVEDSVVGYGKGYDQKNYFNTSVGHEFYKKGDSIYGYAHHRVVRKVPTGAWGYIGAIPKSPRVGTLYAHTFSDIVIPLKYNERALDVIAFVSYYDTSASRRQVINSASSRMMGSLSEVPNDDPKRENQIICPNPVNDKCRFLLPPGQSCAGLLQITNAQGIEMKSIKVEEGTDEISVRDIPDGFYFYVLRGVDGSSRNGIFFKIN